MEFISYFLFSQSIHSFYMYSRAIVQRSFFFKKMGPPTILRPYYFIQFCKYWIAAAASTLAA